MIRFHHFKIADRKKIVANIESKFVQLSPSGLLSGNAKSSKKFFANMIQLLQQDLQNIKIYLLYHLKEAMAQYTATNHYYLLTFWSGSASLRNFQEKIEIIDQLEDPTIDDFIKLIEDLLINGPGGWKPSSLKYFAFKKIISSIVDPDYKAPVSENEGSLLIGTFVEYFGLVVDHFAQIEYAKVLKPQADETSHTPQL